MLDAKTLVRSLDEALRLIELRRYRRIFQTARMPVVYTLGVFLIAWMLVPFLFSEGGVLAGQNPISANRGFSGGVLMVCASIAAGLGGYLRSQQLWQQERQLQNFHTWLLTHQSPVRVAATTIVMASLLGMALAAIPAALGLLVGLFAGFGVLELALYALLYPLCALLGAALGAMVFFVSYGLLPRPYYYPGLVALGLVLLGLWLRIEAVENGWHRSWDEHPARIALALSLVTPAPVLFGIAAPHWWAGYAPPHLGVALPVWLGALVYAVVLLVAGLLAAVAAVRGYLRLSENPALIEKKPRAPTEEGGEEFYWKGFKNPVWTRDIRTRLRSKDTAEFIFFASIAVAAGAFAPLVMTASDLSDPLQTARAARHVFFWLTMTLVALVALVAPGLTADVISQERTSGTLEMLVGSPLRPRDILVGKLLGAVSVLLLLLSPSLPLFGLCYLFRGCSGEQVVQVYFLLVVTLAVSAFIGLAQSAINSKTGSAKFWAYSITACFLAIPGGPFWLAAAAAAPQADMRQELVRQGAVAALVGVIWIFVLGLFWGNASEALEYSEY